MRGPPAAMREILLAGGATFKRSWNCGPSATVPAARALFATKVNFLWNHAGFALFAYKDLGRDRLLRYPAKLTPGEGDKVMLVIPDVPEAVVVGSHGDDIFDRAALHLEQVLDGYCSAGRLIPLPSRIEAEAVVETKRFTPHGRDPLAQCDLFARGALAIV